MKNCPNCGAPIEPYKCKCDYCGTWYFDFTSFFEDGKPCYIKYKTDLGVLTALVQPQLRTIDITEEIFNIIGRESVHIMDIPKYRSCDLEVTFHTLVDHENNTLFTLEAEDADNLHMP